MDTTETPETSDIPEPNERDEPEPRDEGRRTFRRTLLRVLAVQVVALALLWLLQAGFNG